MKRGPKVPNGFLDPCAIVRRRGAEHPELLVYNNQHIYGYHLKYNQYDKGR